MNQRQFNSMVGVLTLVFGIGATPITEATRAKAAESQSKPQVSDARFARLSRGVSVTGWFDHPRTKNPTDAHFREHFTSRDAELLAGLGITHVRLPIDPFFLLDEKSPATLNAPQLAAVDAAIDVCLKHDLAVIVDMHAERIEEFSKRVETDAAFADAFITFWAALAKHLSRTDPDRVFLEVMNEPVFVTWQPKYDPKSAQWSEVQSRIVAAIRGGAPRHTIIVGGIQWSSIDGLKMLQPLADPNLVYNFHFYEPHPLTHQAATWGDGRWRHLANLPYPSSPDAVAPVLPTIGDAPARKLAQEYGQQRWDAGRVEKRIAEAAAWAARHRVRLTCNEFGVYRSKTPPEARLRWLRDVREAFDKHRIGWTMWEYAGGFGLVQDDKGRRAPDQAVAEALGLKTAEVKQFGNHPNFLNVVRHYADTMIDRGRDTYGPKNWPVLSALDRTTLSPLTVRPAAPAGIRREDRCGEPWNALVGANVQLDQNLFRILYVLGQITGNPKYAQAADDELTWFFKNTLSPKTSLLPWGEHMSWGVIEDKPISGANEGIHEFTRPWVLWDRSFALAPQECERFARGLWEHQIANHKTGGFDRHAPYFEHGPVDGKDFPRHAGFYIVTWANAYKHNSDQTFLRAIETLLARFERKRIGKEGKMAATIGPLDCETAAALLPQPLSARLRAFAEKEDELVLADLYKQFEPAERPGAVQPLWKNGYSAPTLASTALLCLARFEQVPKPPYRQMLIAIADKYVDTSPEEDLDAWPLAFAHAISAQAAAYRFTERPVYLKEANRLAQMAIHLFWQDSPLPRASLKTGHYETITGAESLALALLEVHAINERLTVKLPSNTIDR